MKTIKITIIIVAIAFGQFTIAQDKPKGKEKIYTPEQIEMLKTQKAAVKENREELKSSLTDEQLAIMENKDLGRRERMEALRTFRQAGLSTTHIPPGRAHAKYSSC